MVCLSDGSEGRGLLPTHTTPFFIYLSPSSTCGPRVEPSPDAPETIELNPPSYVDPIDLQCSFGRIAPIEIELGAGDGSFLVQWAGANPATNFLGLERLLGRLRKIERKATRGGLLNLRVLRLEAAYFTEFLLPDCSI